MAPADTGKDSKQFTLENRLKSFGSAFSGLRLILKNEHNFRIHIFILVVVIIAGIYFKIKATDWIAVAVVSGLVLSAECFNSAIEYLSDAVSPEVNPVIKNVKDAAAAGVLIAAIIAAVTGIIIFLPEIIEALHEHSGN